MWKDILKKDCGCGCNSCEDEEEVTKRGRSNFKARHNCDKNKLSVGY